MPIKCNLAKNFHRAEQTSTKDAIAPIAPTLREVDDGTVTVAFMDTEAVLRLVDKPYVHTIHKQVQTLLQRVSAGLKA